MITLELTINQFVCLCTFALSTNSNLKIIYFSLVQFNICDTECRSPAITLGDCGWFSVTTVHGCPTEDCNVDVARSIVETRNYTPCSTFLTTKLRLSDSLAVWQPCWGCHVLRCWTSACDCWDGRWPINNNIVQVSVNRNDLMYTLQSDALPWTPATFTIFAVHWMNKSVTVN